MLTLTNTDIIQVVWDEINSLDPDKKRAEIKRVEKAQPDMVKFIHEELESTGVPYSEQFMQWTDLCLRIVKEASEKTKIPKIKLDELQEHIERNEEEFGFDDIDDACEASKNVLLEHIMDLIHNVDLDADDEGEGFQGDGDEESESDMDEPLDNYDQSEYNEYEMEEEEGDEDDIMFREMYNAHDDSGNENSLTDAEEAVYTLFLIFKSIIDVLMNKMG